MHLHRPEIAIVIPTYNRAAQLYLTLASLAAQTLEKARFEVIVIDDGGSDGSEQVVADFSHSLSIRYFWQQDRGFRAGKARNVGTMMAEAELILYIDCGVLLASDCLVQHLRLHQIPEQVVIGYVYGFEADFHQVQTCLRQVDCSDANAGIQALRQARYMDVRQQQYDVLGSQIGQWPAPYDIFWTCHVSAQRQQLIAAGLFDETFDTWGGEDVDLGLRLHQRQNRFVLATDACSMHLPVPFDIEERKRLSAIAGRRIHKKHALYATSFYGMDTVDQKFSLNQAILRADQFFLQYE